MQSANTIYKYINNYQGWLNDHMKMDDEISKLAVRILE